MGRAPAPPPPQKKRSRDARASVAAAPKSRFESRPFWEPGLPAPRRGRRIPALLRAAPGRPRKERGARVWGGRRGGGCGKAALRPPRPCSWECDFAKAGGGCGSKKTGTPNRPLFPPPLDKPRAPKGSSPFGSGNHAPPKGGARRLAAWPLGAMKMAKIGPNAPPPPKKNASPSRRARPCSPVAPSAPKSRFCRTDATAPRR